MTPRRGLNMLTRGAMRTILLGSPIRGGVAGVLTFLISTMCLITFGVDQQWAVGTALAMLVACSAALVYARNEFHYQQLEAITRLTSALKLPVPLPPMRGWRLSPDAAVILVHHLHRLRARQVVEAGCGASTVLIAAIMKQQGTGTVISLEHDPRQVAASRQQLQMLELEAHAIVLHAPIIQHSISGKTWLWYDLETLHEQLSKSAPIDLLLIDGPPVWTQKQARYPALPLLAGELNTQGGVILLDDAKRISEQRVLRRWQVEFPGWSWSHEPTEDGLAIGIASTEAD